MVAGFIGRLFRPEHAPDASRSAAVQPAFDGLLVHLWDPRMDAVWAARTATSVERARAAQCLQGSVVAIAYDEDGNLESVYLQLADSRLIAIAAVEAGTMTEDGFPWRLTLLPMRASYVPRLDVRMAGPWRFERLEMLERDGVEDSLTLTSDEGEVLTFFAGGGDFVNFKAGRIPPQRPSRVAWALP